MNNGVNDEGQVSLPSTGMASEEKANAEEFGGSAKEEQGMD